MIGQIIGSLGGLAASYIDGKTADVKVPTMSGRRGVARGMGAAKKGGGYIEC